jgi:spermidine synthase
MQSLHDFFTAINNSFQVNAAMSKSLKNGLKPSNLSTFSLFVLLCFFFSGLAGLIYQILWLRMIDKVVGSAPFAVAIVLSVFMGGLALGSWLAGKYVDTISSRGNLLSLYGKAELAIGMYGLMLPLFIHLAKPLYILAYNSLFAHFWLYRFFTFSGCSLLLLVPTTLMGITLPVLCRFYVDDLGHIGARTGRLYGINTIGGAAGAVLCGFFLIEALGIWGTLAVAVGINILIGLLCIHMSKNTTSFADEPIKHPEKNIKSKNRNTLKETGNPAPVPVDDGMVINLALWIFGISGFCAMAYEVIWTRLLGLILGPTTYSFSLVVSTFIIGLALGNIIFGRLADRVQGTFRLLVITQISAGCLALLISHFLGNSQFFFSKLIYTFNGSFGEKIFSQSLALFFVLVWPTIFLGATFPLVNKIYTRSLPELGKSIGSAYAVNTLGAILGSFIAGFIFIPFFGKENGLRITTGLQILVSLIGLAYLVFKAGERKRAYAAAFASLALCVLLLVNFPSWDHSILARGWYYGFDSLEGLLSKTSWFEAVSKGPSKLTESVKDKEVIFYGDGIGGFTTVDKSDSPIGNANYTLMNSGKTDATSHSGRLTQALSSQIPLLFHPAPEKVMVIGLASGMTAGEALLYPIKQLDVVEINDQVIKAAGLFGRWNYNCLKNPRTHVIEQDGRNHLELTREKYDVIISVPSNPWMAGLSNLFSLDYFKTVKRRLNNNGIFVQWISAYDMDWDSFAMIGRTFAEAFPNSMLVNAMSMSDFLLVGFTDGQKLNLNEANKNIVYARQSKNITIRDPKVILNLIASENLKEFFGPGTLHTDNMPHLEFIAPKKLGLESDFIKDRIKNSSLLTKETKEIMESNKSVDASLDYLELVKAGPLPPFKDVDLSKASQAQIKRYHDILNDYCSSEDVTDYSIFPNHELQKQCAQLQIGKIKSHIASSPEGSKNYYNLAHGLGVFGRTGDEIDALKKALSINPSYFNARMELGQILALQGKFDEAIEQLSEALEVRPSSAEAHNNIGNVYADADRTADAMEHFSRALQIKPDSAETYNNLGSLYAGLGKIDLAIENFSRAIKLVPDYAVAHDNLGRVLAGLERLDEALAHTYEALKTSPESADFHNDAGLILGQQGKISESASEFAEALRINPSHFLANYNLGVALSGQGKVSEALNYFSRAAEIKPNDPEVHRMMGMAFENLNRFNDALEHFAEALKLDPQSAENHDNLGVALAETGQLDKAISEFKKALETDSSYEKARYHLSSAEQALERRR